MRLKPPTIAWTLLILAIIFHFVFPEPKLIRFPYNLTGIIFIGLGIFFMGWAIRLFEREKTSHKIGQRPTKLVTNGVYEITRNPMYLGMVVEFLGIALLVGTVPFFFMPLAFLFIMNLFFIPHEEKILEKEFGKIYLDYKRKVRRWL